MIKKYLVTLTKKEQLECHEILKRCLAASQKARRAQILLKADLNGLAWSDQKIAEAFGSKTQTIEMIRLRFVTEGFETALYGKKRIEPPQDQKLDGKQEAKLIALRLGKPPAGFGNWSLRLLADQMVELGIIDSISYETVRKVLKKTA